MLFDVTFDTDARYGSVQGSQLWVLQVAVSNAPSPNFASLTSTLATLNGAEMNMGVEGGNPLTFQDTSVSIFFIGKTVFSLITPWKRHITILEYSRVHTIVCNKTSLSLL